MLEECTNKEIETAAREVFYDNEENYGCSIQYVSVNRNQGMVKLRIGGSPNAKVLWDETIDFEEIDPFIKIDS